VLDLGKLPLTNQEDLFSPVVPKEKLHDLTPTLVPLSRSKKILRVLNECLRSPQVRSLVNEQTLLKWLQDTMIPPQQVPSRSPHRDILLNVIISELATLASTADDENRLRATAMENIQRIAERELKAIAPPA
jgi:hypothetical protein